MSRNSFQPGISPEKYIRTRARSLPIGDCFINPDWQDSGMAMIIVTRKHVTGNLTFAVFQIDLYCLGVKDAFWRFNEPQESLDYIMEQYVSFSQTDDGMEKADYNLVHNIIYSAEAFADDIGFSGNKDFQLASFILEDDDERIELMDIEFGMEGFPAVFQGREDYPKNVFAILDKNVGKGNYFIFSENGEAIQEPCPGEQQEQEDITKKRSERDGIKPMNRDMVNLANDRLMKYIGEQNFESIEQVQEFFAKNLTGKKIDEIVPLKKGRKSNAEKADDLIYKAYQSEPEEGTTLAGQALELDPENVRAYNYLAQNEPIPAKALALFEKAALTAERKLGAEFFEHYQGKFWGMTETRPYMTARAGMAECLTVMGKEKDAIKIYQEMLRLNPGDNQGIRYELARLFLKTNMFDRFIKLYKKNEDEKSTFFLYHYVYYIYHTEGSGELLDKAFENASNANSHVLDMLTGKKKLPKKWGDYYTPGQPNEAAYFLMLNLEMWMEVEGLMKALANYMLRKERR